METTAPPVLEHLPVQYGDASGNVTADPDTAVTATYFTPTAEVVLSLTRTSRGRWAYATSDFAAVSPSLSRKRWASPAIALADVAYLRRHTHTREVQP